MLLSAPAIHPPESDLSLLQRYIESNDPEIFAQIVRQYSGIVYTASRRVLNDEAQAQEVSQEVFFRLMRQPRLVSQSLAGWLHRSATHLAIDVRRSETARRHRERGYCADRIATNQPPESKWEDISRHIDAALNELPDPERALLTRHFLQGVSQADLAAESNLSSATMSRRIKAAVTELRTLLKKKGIYVGLVALVEFCKTESAKAAPAQFVTELSRMGAAGPINVAPPAAPGPPPPRGSFFQLRSVIADSSWHFVGTCIGVVGLVIWLSIATVGWTIHGHSSRGAATTSSTDQKISDSGSPQRPAIR